MTGEGKGWISLYRSIQDHWIWQEKPYDKAHAWLDILLSANHQDKKIVFDSNLVEVKRGEFITSIRKLCERWGWSNSKVKKFLDTLQSDGMITYKSDTKKTAINIVNYNVYQTLSDAENVTETSQKHHRNITETSQKHTNNNDNNDNNENKRESKTHSQSLEICKYYSELLPGQNITQHLTVIKIWIDMYGYDWTKEAIQKCASSKNKFIKPWIEKVLKNWQVEGKEEVNGATNTGNDNKEGKGKYAGFKPAPPKIAEDTDTTDLI